MSYCFDSIKVIYSILLYFCIIFPMLSNSLKLGSLVLKSKAILSPLEGVSDIGFRNLCESLGAGLSWTEMVRGQGILKNNAATYSLIDTFDPNANHGLQLLVKSPTELANTLLKIEHLSTTTHPHFQNIKAIDLNFGCPSKDIIQIGAGPAMLKRKTKLSEIFHELKKWKDTTTMKNIGAIGCKIRLGLNMNEMENKIYLSVTESACEAGLDYITVHGRHGQQRSSSPAVWEPIKEVKRISSIPVIGNGDIWTRDDMKKIIEITGCDGVMVARTAIRNPWIFRELSQFNLNLNESFPTEQEILHAIDTYQISINQYHTKEKYATFNLKNLYRILNEIQKNNKHYQYIGPNSIHML